MNAPIDVVGRTSALLKALAAAETDGATTTEAAAAAGLPRATAHRLLSSLAEVGMVERSPSGRWLLGPELYLFGLAAAPRYDVTSLAGPAVRRLAAATGESAFFSARRGSETICLVREDGAFPIRSHVLYEGLRLPIGVASAGLAIAAFMGEAELEAHLAEHDLTAEYGEAHSVQALGERIAQTRALGYAVNPGLLVEGSWGMAAAVFDSAERPAWALSLTGIEHRFSPARRREMGALLLAEAHALSTALRGR